MRLANFFILSYILLIPYVGGYISVSKIAGLTFSAARYFYVISAILLVGLLIWNRYKLKVSGMVMWFLLFTIYLVVNPIVQGVSPPKSEIVNLILPVIFLIFIENVDYKRTDFNILHKILIVVGIGSFIASFIQLTIDPFFYSGVVNQVDVIEDIKRYRVDEGLYRTNSLYRGLGYQQSGVALGCLFIYFLFMNYYKVKTINVVLTVLVFFAAFVTFHKYVWAMCLIALAIFVYFKYRREKYVLFLLGLVVLFCIYFIYMDDIVQTSIWQNRVASDTYKGRTETTVIFIERFFMTKPIFGFGITSFQSPEYLRQHAGFGVHVGFLDIVFRGGLVGLSLLSLFLYKLYTKSMQVIRRTGNPVFLVFLLSYIFINFTALFIDMSYFGYHVMLVFLALYDKVNLAKPAKVKFRSPHPKLVSPALPVSKTS